MSKVKSYFIKTFGCQANEADSERLAAVFEKQGHALAKKIDEADLVIINTCSVRESAENRVFGMVNNLTKLKAQNLKLKTTTKKLKSERPKIILTGCMVGSAKGDRRRYTFRQLKMKLPQVDEFKTIDELLGETQIKPKRKHKHSAFVPIMRGCNHFCAYCVVPYARGKEVSRPFEEIVCEVEELARRGYREVMLLGQNVNSYGRDFSQEELRVLKGRFRVLIHGNENATSNHAPFALLLRVLHEIKGLKKISFITSNPWDLGDEIIEAMALPKIDRHFHLPVQSGDDKILKRMNRPYKAKQYIELIEKVRKRVPDIRISTDLIVGFPGETKKQFENTVELCKKAGFFKAYIARYSPRPGTAAFKLKDDVPPAEKKRRWQVLEELINRKT